MKAFRLAQQERPGPVHLELPQDIAGEEVPEIPLVKLHPIDIPVADSAALDRAAKCDVYWVRLHDRISGASSAAM